MALNYLAFLRLVLTGVWFRVRHHSLSQLYGRTHAEQLWQEQRATAFLECHRECLLDQAVAASQPQAGYKRLRGLFGVCERGEMRVIRRGIKLVTA